MNIGEMSMSEIFDNLIKAQLELDKYEEQVLSTTNDRQEAAKKFATEWWRLTDKACGGTVFFAAKVYGKLYPYIAESDDITKVKVPDYILSSGTVPVCNSMIGDIFVSYVRAARKESEELSVYEANYISHRKELEKWMPYAKSKIFQDDKGHYVMAVIMDGRISFSPIVIAVED